MIRQDRPLPRALWALGAGALAGLAAGCKMTGLAALGLIGLCIAVSLLRDRSVEMLRRSLADGTLVLASAIVVYLAGWMLHFALLDQPGPGDIWGKPTGSPWVDIPNTIGRIFTAARDITAGHPYASPWWSWPLMLRSVSYWSSGGHHLHFLGNPMVWWGSTLALAVIAITPYLVRTTDLSLPEGRSVWPENLWVVLCGWGLAFFPLALLTRVMFLYHYLTPVVFAVCAAVLWLDHVGWIRSGRLRDQRLSYYLAIAAIVAGFAAISPFTLPYVKAKAYQAAVLAALPGWI